MTVSGRQGGEEVRWLGPMAEPATPVGLLGLMGQFRPQMQIGPPRLYGRVG
jgi:hypothetical protein